MSGHLSNKNIYLLIKIGIMVTSDFGWKWVKVIFKLLIASFMLPILDFKLV